MAGNNNNLRKQASVFEFYGLLLRQIKDLESQYTQYKKMRRLEQLNGGTGQAAV